MGRLRFTKMQGAGNDYIYVNLTQEELSKPAGELAPLLCPRRFAIGADGLVLIDKGQGTDLKRRMFNADGSEAEMCSNAIRCVALYGYQHGLVTEKSLTVDTLAGTKYLDLIEDEAGQVSRVKVNMGVPELRPAFIPAKVEGGPVIEQNFEFDGFSLKGSLVSMGNPHFITFVDDVETVDVETMGRDQVYRFDRR